RRIYDGQVDARQRTPGVGDLLRRVGGEEAAVRDPVHARVLLGGRDRERAVIDAPDKLRRRREVQRDRTDTAVNVQHDFVSAEGRELADLLVKLPRRQR